jgi:hypothetical protein
MITTSEKLKMIFSHHCEYKPTFYIYHTHPNKHNTAKEVLQADKRAARDIEELQEAIDNLKQIRTALADRYNELATMPYTYSLELTRYHGWRGSNITYTVRITRVYEDESTAEELRETFPGKERHKAIARYKELQKSHPGITCSMDIEKSRWER